MMMYKMNVNKAFLILVLFLVFIPCALGVEFTPQGNINLRSVYSIINGVDVNATNFYGDGSGLTNLNVSGINLTTASVNYSVYANSSTYWDDETSQANLNVNSSNSSTYWGTYSSYTDFQSLLSILWSQITGVPTLLSNFTNDIDLINSTYANNTYILQTSESSLDVNSANYWDSLNTPADITSLGTISSATSITSTAFVGALTGNADTVTNGVYTTDFPLNQDTIGNAGTATALASNPTDCSSGYAPQTIDASGNFGSCTQYLQSETYVGTVTSIATTAPISGGTITSTGTISLDTATPSDGDTTHASTADQIYDWVIGLGYSTTDTTYTAGNGISLSTTTFSVAGNTALTQDSDGLSVTADAIGDTQLEYNTGQHLTTTSNPTFNNQTITDCIIFASGGKICSGT